MKITVKETGTERNLKAVYKTAVTGSITVRDVRLGDVFLSVSLRLDLVREITMPNVE
jgi:hypothetical protein